MKRCVLGLLLGVVVLFPLAGCETLYQTAGENQNMVVNTGAEDMRMLPMDAERVLLLDRPTWMSPAPMPSFY